VLAAADIDPPLLKSRDILIATAGVAIYPFPRTKSSASAAVGPKARKDRGKIGFCFGSQAKQRQYWQLSKKPAE
jgi:hypothetical protein